MHPLGGYKYSYTLPIVAYFYVTILPRKTRPVATGNLLEQRTTASLNFLDQKKSVLQRLPAWQLKLPKPLKDKAELDLQLLPMALNLTFKIHNCFLPAPSVFCNSTMGSFLILAFHLPLLFAGKPFQIHCIPFVFVTLLPVGARQVGCTEGAQLAPWAVLFSSERKHSHV